MEVNQQDFYLKILSDIKDIYLTKNVPYVTNLLGSMVNNLSNVIYIFNQKSLIEGDRYLEINRENFDELLPDDKTIDIETDKTQCYTRLLKIKLTYQYLSNKFSQVKFVPENLLEQARVISGMAHFHDLNHKSHNTVMLNELFNIAVNENNPEIRKKIFQNKSFLASNQDKLNKKIIELSRFNKNLYTMHLRLVVFPKLENPVFNLSGYEQNPDQFVKLVKDEIENNCPDIDFIQYYVNEALIEHFTTNIEIALEDLKDQFLTIKEVTDIQVSPKVFLQTIMIYTTQVIPFYEDLEQISSKAYKKYCFHQKNFFSTILDLFLIIFRLPRPEQDMEINYFDAKINTFKKEKLTFSRFRINNKNLLKTLYQIQEQESDLSKKMKDATIRSLYQFLFHLYLDILNSKEQYIGLNNEFLTVLKSKYEEKEIIDIKIDKIEQLLNKILAKLKIAVTLIKKEKNKA
ncbi:MAG: hypothetical protein MJB14_11190 [Spirochaetes bacterium]|nr:hypothetical protein [Spirochaetota bacterium]